MIVSRIINELSRNKALLEHLLKDIKKEKYLWRPEPSKWCLLEILCHLYDEEREDFRVRVKHILDGKDSPMPPINPEAWAKERNYISNNYEEMLQLLVNERSKSLTWLKSLQNVDWKKSYTHPTVGNRTALFYLENWLAHDYLHIRQINRLNYNYLHLSSENDLSYAGNW